MNFRKLISCLVCVGCFVFGGMTLSQERKRDIRPEFDEESVPPNVQRRVERIEKSGTIERRVQDLEKQVRALSLEMEALRKELKPTANQPGRPRPL